MIRRASNRAAPLPPLVEPRPAWKAFVLRLLAKIGIRFDD